MFEYYLNTDSPLTTNNELKNFTISYKLACQMQFSKINIELIQILKQFCSLKYKINLLFCNLANFKYVCKEGIDTAINRFSWELESYQ